MRVRKALIGGAAAIALGALFAPAGAATQTVDASLGSSVTFNSTPANVSGWALASSGANTRSGGTMEVSANVPYVVTLSAEKATMSEWNSGAYVTNGKSLSSALTVTASRTGGTAAVAGVGLVTPAATTAANLVTGTGGGTDAFSLSFSQPTVITDQPLSGTATYHNLLTYTATATL